MSPKAQVQTPYLVSKTSKMEVPCTLGECAVILPSNAKSGRWTIEEHKMFLQGLNKFGKDWKQISSLISTRSIVQVRTHAQKFFQKVAREKFASQGKSVPDCLLSTALKNANLSSLSEVLATTATEPPKLTNTKRASTPIVRKAKKTKADLLSWQNTSFERSQSACSSFSEDTFMMFGRAEPFEKISEDFFMESLFDPEPEECIFDMDSEFKREGFESVW